MIAGRKWRAGSVRPNSQLRMLSAVVPMSVAASSWRSPRSIRRARKCSPRVFGSVG